MVTDRRGHGVEAVREMLHMFSDRWIGDDGDRLLLADASGAVRTVRQRIAEETPQDDHAHHDDDRDQGGDHSDADTASATVVAVTAAPLAAGPMAAGQRRRWRRRRRRAASREVGKVIRRVDVGGGQILLGLLRVGETARVFAVLVGGLVEVEKAWTVRKVVGKTRADAPDSAAPG